tara:strand:+ start:810 stop:1964 length:1155 start_codon:yes stop_codon:yes gene_type:complete
MKNKNRSMNEFPLMSEKKGVPLFYPYISPNAKKSLEKTLSSRWIGQGPKVDLFEKKFEKKFLTSQRALAVGSGTDALHLSYILSDIKKGDEVLVPVFTCTATNIPLLYIGAKPVFVDVDIDTMNISIEDLKKKITKKTKAIVCVDYGGVPNNYYALLKICKERNLKLISDGAHSLGSKYLGKHVATYSDFTTYSFQAIKTITTGDGGMLVIKDRKLYDKAKRLRWFGIDRSKKQSGIWDNDLKEIGYKYQMTDVSASLGLAALKDINNIIKKRNNLFKIYERELKKNKSIKIIGKSKTKEYFNSAWLITILLKEGKRLQIMKKLRKKNIESAQVHYRNDRYSIFGGRRNDLPNMDKIENQYLVLPLHPRISLKQAKYICDVINQ